MKVEDILKYECCPKCLGIYYVITIVDETDIYVKCYDCENTHKHSNRINRQKIREIKLKRILNRN